MTTHNSEALSLHHRRMTTRARRVSAVAVLFLLGLGCSGTDNPADLPQCQGPVTVSVSSGTVPRFSWTPACLAGQLGVTLNTGFVTLWLVTDTTNTNSLRPPVRYGTPPDSAALGTPRLVVGEAYTVHLLRATGDSTAPFESIGSADFTP